LGSFELHLNGYGFLIVCGTLAALLISLDPQQLGESRSRKPRNG